MPTKNVTWIDEVIGQLAQYYTRLPPNARTLSTPVYIALGILWNRVLLFILLLPFLFFLFFFFVFIFRTVAQRLLDYTPTAATYRRL